MLSSLKSTIAQYGLATKKSLGQHFLLDENICAKIAAQAGDMAGCNIIEIGPGPGGLTRAVLATKAASLVAVEMDARCVEALQELVAVSSDKLRVVHADAMKISLPTLCNAPRKIVANLPYNVGTALLVRWLEDIYADPTAYQSLTLMFQQEVADRIASAPNTKDYGRLSVMAQWLCDVVPRFVLPPGAFSPPPKVHSTVLTLIPRPTPLYAADKRALEKVLAAGFGNRRKMLRAALKSLFPEAERLLTRSNIDPTRRAETLNVEEWCRLSNSYNALINPSSQH